VLHSITARFCLRSYYSSIWLPFSNLQTWSRNTNWSRLRVGEANPLFSLCRALWRPTAPASWRKSRRTAEESRTISDWTLMSKAKCQPCVLFFWRHFKLRLARSIINDEIHFFKRTIKCTYYVVVGCHDICWQQSVRFHLPRYSMHN
jgi:hypothetical protein